MNPEPQHYSRYIAIKKTFSPTMTRELIDVSPRRWMDFYPHESFLELLDEILKAMHGGEKPIWVVGNYGTGKTNAVLVIQKLFMDDESRVEQWFDQNKDIISTRFPDIQEELSQCRDEGTFVVYDYNSGGVGPDRELIVRLEKTIVKDLKDNGFIIPPASPLSQVVDRIKEEGEAFEKKLDELREQFQIIDRAETVEDVVEILESTTNGDDSTRALSEVETVLRARDIFLNIDVPGFRDWISRICQANGLERVVFIFDEFSEFISNNTANLKTFEELAESLSLHKFMFIPVTHLGLGAFRSDTSNSAQKSEDRFNIQTISMPNNIAFELIAHAIKKDLPQDVAEEWNGIKLNLWASVKDSADKLNIALNTRQDSKFQQTLEDMLPIHPMTGFMLKTLCVLVGSNQRSIFNFLSDGDGPGTFRAFIDEGGPGIWGKTFLTIDYLWDFFTNSTDLGPNKEVNEIRSYYLKFTSSGPLKGKTDDDQEIRILKTVLLFMLYSNLATEGISLLQPTRDNIVLSYMGDPSMSNIDILLDSLSEISCISVRKDGVISLFASSVDDREVEKRAEELGKKFNSLNEVTTNKISDHLKSQLATYPPKRFEIKVSNPDEVRVPNEAFVDKFGDGPKNEGAICLWFIIAKDNDEKLRIVDKVSNCFKAQGANCRLVFFSFDNLTFCSSNKDEWNEYVLNLAKIDLENSASVRQNLIGYKEKIESFWLDKIVRCESITFYHISAERLETEKITWNQFKKILRDLDDHFLKGNIDNLVDSPTFGTRAGNYRSAAIAGMTLETNNTQIKYLIRQFTDKGYKNDSSWFADHPDHPLTMVHALIINKLESDLGKGRNFSLDEVYVTLRRSPFGFRPVMMTAIVLGFCMNDLIDKGYQWTDGRLSDPLDQDSLGRIIESTINGQGNSGRGRKEICRPTREDLAFRDGAPRMFGIEQKAGSAREAIDLITNRFESISNKVPIWVIPDFVRSGGDPDAEAIASAIENIAIAASISAKGDQEKRIEAIRDVGGELIKDPDLPAKVSKYIKKEIFQDAFISYIRDNYPEMNRIAEDVQDRNYVYIRSIINKMTETASFLWKKINLDENVNQVMAEYRLIRTTRSISSSESFVDFHKALQLLEDGIKRSPVPISIILKRYPQVDDVIDGIDQLKNSQPSSIMDTIDDRIDANADDIRRIFFDNSRSELISILKSNYDTGDIPDDGLKSIVRDIVQNSDGAGISEMPEDEFAGLLDSELERYRAESLKTRIAEIWRKKTNTSDMHEWEKSNNMPAKYAFPDMQNDVFDRIRDPDSYNRNSLEKAIEIFDEQDPPSVDRSRERFMVAMIPGQYRGFIGFSDLVHYLKGVNEDPSAWDQDIDLKPMIHSKYNESIVQKVKELVNSMDPEDLKRTILENVDDSEDLGIELIKAIR